MRWLKVYSRFLTMGFLELMAYRVTIIMLLISMPIILFARYYLFESVFEGAGQKIDGYNVRDILVYVACAYTLRSFLRTHISLRIGRAVRSGDIVFDLMRPLNFHIMMLFRSLGKSLNRFVFISIPLILFLFLVDVFELDFGASRFLSTTFAVLLASWLAFELEFFIGMLSIFIGYNIGIIWSFEMITHFLAGLVIPLHFFPEYMANIILVLPFRHIYYSPIQMFMGITNGSENLWLLANALFWCVLFSGINTLVYRSSRKHMAIAGG